MYRIIVYNKLTDFYARIDATRHLFGHMPGLMRQVPFLSGGLMDAHTLFFGRNPKAFKSVRIVPPNLFQFLIYFFFFHITSVIFLQQAYLPEVK